jgi:TPR repeat protein
VARDDPKALHWLRAAADQKQPEAEYLLAVVYRFGWLGTGRNPKQSLLLLQRSALQGHAPAQFDLGLAYIDGQIVKPDPQEALGWLMRAARQGHGQAIEYVDRIQDRLKNEKAR